jgi:signal transduction histidine kinase
MRGSDMTATLLKALGRLRHPVLPRRTVRLRLTLLYGGLFLACGAGLLFITYLLVAHRLPSYVGHQESGKNVSSSTVIAFGNGGGNGCRLSTQDLPAQFGPSGGNPSALTGPQQLVTRGLNREAQTVQQCLASQQASEMNRLLTESGIALAIMTVAAAGLGWLVADRALRPVRTITAAARSVSASSLNARLALTGPDDELKELGDTFDALLARLEAAFAAQRQFVANASHELRTPLARQQTLIEVALADPQATVASLRGTCERVLAAGQEQERLIEALLTLARSERGLDRRDPVDLRDLAGDVVEARAFEAQARGVNLTADLGPAVTPGDSRLAERLIANLVDNAIRHNITGGQARVTTRATSDGALLSVANTGPGVPPDQVERLFRSFQRLDASRTIRDGVGLGLPIAVAIAAAHGGVLRARPNPGGGLEVEVRFPPPGEAAAGAPAPVTAAVQPPAELARIR